MQFSCMHHQLTEPLGQDLGRDCMVSNLAGVLIDNTEVLSVCHAQAQLRGALDIELGMGYMEPERLWQPVRHCLAYVLLLSGQAQAAAEVRG